MTSREEYLKRYLSKSESKPVKTPGLKNKKSRIHRSDKSTGLKIVDDDIDMKALDKKRKQEEALQAAEDEDTPTVAEVIDERPEHVKQLEAFRQNKNWKVLQSIDSKSETFPHRKRRRHDSDGSVDVSPPRRPQIRHDSDESPPRKPQARHDSEPDASPLRRPLAGAAGRHRHDSDESPPRNPQARHNSDPDASPPRRPLAGAAGRHRHDSDESPPRRPQARSHCNTDLSPPRRPQARRGRHDSDESPPRRTRARNDSEPDVSLPRSQPKKGKVDDDLSPPRVRKQEKGVFAMKTMSGATAGLQSGREMTKEARMLRAKDDVAFNQMSDEVSGRNASTVQRDKKSGKRRDFGEEKRIQDLEDAKKEEEMEKYKRWNKGLKQQELQGERLADALHEVDKPLARYKDDSDLDALLRDRVRTDEVDPMLAFLTDKGSKNRPGAVVKPRYSGREPLPNRFNIWPGYRWDGVDRSNGFEKQFFASTAERKVMKDMASKWSVEDM